MTPFEEVPAPDAAAFRRTQRLLRNAASPAAPLPADRLGRFRELAAFWSACRGQVPPQPVGPAEIHVFGAAHGLAARLGRTWRADATKRMAADLRSGASPTHAFAAGAATTVRLVDVGLDRPCGPVDVADAMDGEEFERCLQLGRDAADDAVDRGVDVLATAVFGVGVDTAALAVLGSLTRTEPVALMGFSGTDDRTWRRRVAVLRDAMFRARAADGRPAAALRICGGPDLTAAAGFIAQAAVRRTPVVLDTTATAVAALCAEMTAPGTRAWLIAGQLTPEPAQLLALRRLGLQALFAMNAPLGLGSGALTTLGMLRAAVAVAGGSEAPEPAPDFSGPA